MMLGDPRTDGSYVSMAVDSLSWAKTSAAAGSLFTATTQVSVDAWIRFNGLPANTAAIAQAGVFAFGSQGTSVYFQFNGLPIVLSDPTQAQLLDDHWHYICATFDGSMVRLYIDGQFNTGQSCMGQVPISTNPVLIGQGVQGLVRRVRIYKTNLSAAAVLNNMYGTPASGTLAADFDFSVNPPVDRGPSAYPVSLQNNAIMLKVSPAVSMGTTGFVRPMGDKGINPGGAQVDPYTVQAWVYVTSAVNPVQAIFVNSDLMMDTGMALYLQYDATASAFRLVSQRGSSGQTLTSMGTIPAGVWANVATAFDGTTLSLYLNGVLDSTKACPPIPLYSQVGDLLIGAAIAQGIPSGATTLQGFIREVDVWSRALSATEIASFMANPPDVQSPGLQGAYVFTNSPARNQANGHPIGLAEGAVLSGQLGAAPPTSTEMVRAEAPLPEMGLDPEKMASIRAGIDFSALHKENERAFDEAMADDMAAFGDPKDKVRIKEAWAEARRKLVENPTALPFLTTHHIIDGERLLIVHRPGGSYVAYRAPANAIDDCTMWKVRLVFTLVAGAIDAFTGVGSTLGDKAIVFIGRVLTIPAIAAQMANGIKMTGAAVFTFLSLLYTQGLLRPLILLLIDVGFWTLIRVVANLLLIAAGIGTVRIVASLAATAVTFITVYLSKPASCDPLPTVTLASLAFDYDPTGASVEALTIRRNFGTDVNVPEWIPGKTVAADSPCAYAYSTVSGATPKIQVVVNIPAPTTHAVKIQATGGGILGSIDPITVNFGGVISATITLPLSHHTLASGGVQRQDVTWTWQYQVDGGSWITMATSNHRVYIILATPTQPWQQGANRGNQQLPWTDVLDYACVWTAGAKTSDQVMNLVTTQVNSNIKLVYDTTSGASFYTAESGNLSRFLCGLFVDYLKTGKGNGKIVNCTDCATIVTSFANILGCNASESIMTDSPNVHGFLCNQILAIGTTTWSIPFPTSPNPGVFSYHEVAWTGAGSSLSDPLYDACLQYDTGPNPWGTGPHTAGLPLKVPFTTNLAPIPSPYVPIPTPYTGTSYRERLAANTAAGIPRCIPFGQWPNTNSGRRPVL
ncbi:MAG: LamG domain-containing protein [Burkholderiales bacterium]|nr:LamG domain-containing protein [Burkholderiales bacterium]